jgi:ABC-type transporter Mla MlaB component
MEPSITVFVIDGSIDRADIPAMCDRFHAVVARADPGRVVCDVGALAGPDVAAVDALARLQLTARRLGHQLCLTQASEELQGLVALMGLCGVLRLNGPLAVEPRRQPE